MSAVRLAHLVADAGAEVRGDLPADATFGTIERDARKVAPGDLFIAIRGERFDGHDFVADAAGRGAAAALVRSGPAVAGTSASHSWWSMTRPRRCSGWRRLTGPGWAIA